MLASRLWTLSLGAAIALTASSGISSAQSPKADAAKAGRSKAANGDETAKKSGDEKGGDEKGNRPPGFQIDPAVQLRALRMMVSGGMGGPGGMMGGPGGGGGRGGFGGGGVPPMVTLLLNSPELQEEIALTEDQKTKFKEMKEKTDKERRELFTQMGGQRGGQPGGQPGAQNGGQAGGQRGGQNGGQAGGQRGGGNNIDREAMGLAMAEIGKKTTAEVSKILDKTQKDRLNQIELRILGVPAVVRPDIVKKLNVTPPQLSQIEAILAEQNAAQMEIMASGFGGRGGPGGGQGGPGGQGGAGGGRGQRGGQPAAKGDTAKGDTPKGDTAKADPNAAGENGPGGAGGGRGQRPDFNSPEMQARMAEFSKTITKMSEDSAKIEKKAETAIARILTKNQKTKFNALQGEDFDLTKLALAMNGRGGPGGPGGGRGGAGGATAKGKAANDDN